MRMPKRPVQHVIEAESFRVFATSVPESWIVREVTERDYGIDCYLELVTPKGDLTADLVSVQLKGTSKLRWSGNDTAATTPIARETWSYWLRFPVPVFLFLVDCHAAEVYYESVRWYARRFTEAIFGLDAVPCNVRRANRFDRNFGVVPFLKQYLRDKDRQRFEEAVITFVANVGAYSQFINDNTGRDNFMGVELEREFYARHMRTTFAFLCDYLDLEWNVPSIDQLRKKGQSFFGDTYVLYEATLTELLESLQPKITAILLRLKQQISNEEASYWSTVNHQVLNFFYNIDEKGNLPWMWYQ